MKKNNHKNGNGFSRETIKRLGLYLRNFKKLKEQNVSFISSDKVTQLLNITPVQFRKDLSYFGEFGKRGVGYDVAQLTKEIEKILGLDKKWKIILIGAGKLGSALLGFDGFSKFNIEISHAFDVDKAKIGKLIRSKKIYQLKDMRAVVRRNNIKIAIITTPPEAVQKLVAKLIAMGIKSILNFTPYSLQVPDHITVANVDMACELNSLIFFTNK